MILLLKIQDSYIKDGLVALITDIIIKKYLIGIQLLSICIKIDLCPTTSIGTRMRRQKKIVRIKSEQDRDTGSMVDMVMDAASPKFN